MNYIDGAEFPSEFVSMEEKKTPEYGLKYAKAMISSFNRLGINVFANNEQEYYDLTEFAQGRQSVDSIKRLFGFHPENEDPNEKDSLHYIDIRILNMASTKINQVVEKLCKRKYDVSATNIDPIANNHLKEWETAVKTAKELQVYMQRIGISAGDIFPELNLNVVQIPDEYMLELDMPPKHKMSMMAEKTVKLLLENSNYEMIERDVVWDATVLGHAVMRTFYNSNGVPKVERIHPASFVSNYSKTENYDCLEYAGHYEYLTPNQFIKESAPYLSRQKQQTIIESHRSSHATNKFNLAISYHQLHNDSLSYVPVFRYTFLSEDVEKFVIKKNQYGNKFTKTKSYNYDPDTDPHRDKYESGEWIYTTTTETNVYGGTWVVGSDCVYGHDVLDIPASNLVNRKLPYTVLSPNMKDGRYTSLASQMKEPVFMINTAWNKVKEILAREWVGIMEVDFTAIDNIKIGKGGQQWTARQVMDFLFKKKILVARKQGLNINSPTSAVSFENTGILLADYFNTIQLGLQMLDAVSGTGVGDSTSPPERTGKAVMENAMQASNNALGHLYFSKQMGFKNLIKSLLPMAQMSLAKGNVIKGFLPSIGQKSAEFFEVHKDLSLYDFGLVVENKPSDEEWFDFRQALIKSLDKQTISAADYAFLVDIDNLKQARMTLAAREKKNIQDMRQREDQVMQQQHQNNVEANQVATDNEMKSDQQKHQNKIAEIDRNGMWELRKEKMRNFTLARNQDIDSMAKVRSMEIQGEDKMDAQLVKTQGDIIRAKMTKPKESSSKSGNKK